MTDLTDERLKYLAAVAADPDGPDFTGLEYKDVAAALTRLRVLERVMQRVDATCCEDSSVWIAEAREEVQP